MTISEKFEWFQYFNLETDFWKTKTVFKKLEYLFYTKLAYQTLMLRQIEWWLQNGPITKNGVLPVTTFFLWKFCFSFRTSYKEWFDVPTTQMFIIVLFTSAGVLFDGAFPPRVSLTFFPYSYWNLCPLGFTQKSNSKTEFVNVFY